jgi:uncharacterized membrane protein
MSPVDPKKEAQIQKEERSIRRKLHSAEGRIAEVITSFSGSMYFVYFHVVWFTLWIAASQGWLRPWFRPFDPFPYGLLTMIVSLEAIFLSTFILIAQNRSELLEEYRELEEEQEEQEQEEEVEDIQQDLDDIKSAMKVIADKIGNLEKLHHQTPKNVK